MPKTNFLGQGFQRSQHEQERQRDRQRDATELIENLYSSSKHGRTINSTNQDTNTNQIKTKKQLQSGQKTLEAQFKFGHTFGP